MSSGQSLCLVLKSNDGKTSVAVAKQYRDWARKNLKQIRFDLTSHDLKLLNSFSHPKQKEITKEMALENLIHVPDNFCAKTPLLGEVFSDWDLYEIAERNTELYLILLEAKRNSLDRKAIIPVNSNHIENKQ